MIFFGEKNALLLSEYNTSSHVRSKVNSTNFIQSDEKKWCQSEFLKSLAFMRSKVTKAFVATNQ